MDPDPNAPAPPKADPPKPFQVVGRYTLKAGTTAQKFWALDPALVPNAVGVMVSAAVTPTIWGEDFSTLVLPPEFGVFDILISFSDDYKNLKKKELAADDLQRKYNSIFIAGKPTKDEMPLAVDEHQQARIAFAVPVADGKDSWAGTLTLEANLPNDKKKTITLKLKVNKRETVSDLWIFFVPNGSTGWPKTDYGWAKVKLKGVDTKPVEGAKVRVSVIRDNGGNHYKDINRRVDIESADDGFVSLRERKVLGLPIDWPVLFTVTKDSYVMRGHMLRIASAEVKDNKEPLKAPPTRTEISFMKISEADIAGKQFILDPGHGVLYADRKNRRCQEWMSTHRIAERIQNILTGRFKVDAGNILWTRTAGFGLLNPNEMDEKKAPENGKARYNFDLADPARWRIRVKSATPVAADDRLRELSDLLFTTLDANDAAQAVAESDRAALIKDNADTVAAAAKRRVTAFAPKWRITDGTFSWDGDSTAFTFDMERHLASGKWQDAGTGSVGWDTAANNYIFNFEIPEPVAGESAAAGQHPKLRIDSSDWFAVTTAMMRRLEDRSARWSLKNEIGGGADFPAAARDTMNAAGALDYMKRWCQWSNDRPANDALLVRPTAGSDPDCHNCSDPDGIMGWSVTERLEYFNSAGADFIFTIHENALDPGQEAIGYAGVIAANNPLPDQKRIARTFVKYMDPLDQGLYSHGIYPHNEAALVLSGAHRSKYVYFELEFMTSHDENGNYQYEGMLADDYLSRVAEQAVAGMVEWLLLRQDQATFDAITW